MKKMIILIILRILLVFLIFLIFFFWFVKNSSPKNAYGQKKPSEEYIFPENFMWGTATSAFQNEGGFGKTDWDEWPIYKNGTHEHPGFGEVDIALAAKFGIKYFRFSVEWALAEPENGIFNEKEINLLVSRLRYMQKCGIELFLNFHHFTLPLWLTKRGGCENDSFPFFYNRYVRKITEEIKPLGIKWFMTFNEPSVVIVLGYIQGTYPPGKKLDFGAAKKIEKNIIAAHKLAYKSLHEILSSDKEKINVGIAHFTTRWVSYLRFLQKTNFEFDIEAIKNEMDYIGLNYYGLTEAKFFGESFIEFKTKISPVGIFTLINEFRKYKKPIIITENGINDATDSLRIKFILQHLLWIKRAIDLPSNKEAPVIGYFYWTFIDNYEWDKGMVANFGLVGFDKETKTRIQRPSAFLYRDIIRANGITAEILEKYK